MSFIEVRELSRRYRGVREGDRDQVVFQDFDLDIERGHKVAVVGPSGCGKSTLLHVIGGLESPCRRETRNNQKGQEVVTIEGRGRVSIGGFAISEATPDARADFINRHIGFVFQFHHLIPELTALENILLPMQIQGTRLPQARQRAAELLAAVGLAGEPTRPDKSHDLPAGLSGGERQRVALARALVNQPRLVLADEPTGSLDPARKRSVFNLLTGLASGGVAGEQATVVLVTHDQELLQDEAGRPTVDRQVRLGAGAHQAPSADSAKEV